MPSPATATVTVVLENGLTASYPTWLQVQAPLAATFSTLDDLAPVLAAALATAEDTGITAEQAAMHLKAGAARYWEQAQRAGREGSPQSGTPPTAEESERLRQLEMVRRSLPAAEPNVPGERQ